MIKKYLYIIICVPAFAYSQTAKQFFDTGVQEVKDREYKAAIGDFDKVIELNPNDIDGLNFRGNTKTLVYDYTGAIDDYTKAIAINPHGAEAYANRALAENRIDDYKAALKDCDQAIAINPRYGIAYNNR